MRECVLTFINFHFCFIMFSVEQVDRDGMDMPEARSLEARRAALVERLLELGAEGEHLAEQQLALKKQKGDAKKREALQERLEAIEADEAVFQKRLAQIDFMIKAAATAAAGAPVSTAAATTSSQQQLQQQPATTGKAFKMPDPPWNSAGRTEPLDLS